MASLLWMFRKGRYLHTSILQVDPAQHSTTHLWLRLQTQNLLGLSKKSRTWIVPRACCVSTNLSLQRQFILKQ